MDPVSHREAQSRYLRERTLGSLLGELDSEYPPHIVSILELPPGLDARERESLSLEERWQYLMQEERWQQLMECASEDSLAA